ARLDAASPARGAFACAASRRERPTRGSADAARRARRAGRRRRERPRTERARSARLGYRPALKLVKMRVCTRRIACGTASGGVIRAWSAAERKIVLFSATSFLTNLSDAAFGLA